MPIGTGKSVSSSAHLLRYRLRRTGLVIRQMFAQVANHLATLALLQWSPVNNRGGRSVGDSSYGWPTLICRQACSSGPSSGVNVGDESLLSRRSFVAHVSYSIRDRRGSSGHIDRSGIRHGRRMRPSRSPGALRELVEYPARQHFSQARECSRGSWAEGSSQPESRTGEETANLIDSLPCARQVVHRQLQRSLRRPAQRGSGGGRCV